MTAAAISAVERYILMLWRTCMITASVFCVTRHKFIDNTNFWKKMPKLGTFAKEKVFCTSTMKQSQNEFVHKRLLKSLRNFYKNLTGNNVCNFKPHKNGVLRNGTLGYDTQRNDICIRIYEWIQSPEIYLWETRKKSWFIQISRGILHYCWCYT